MKKLWKWIIRDWWVTRRTIWPYPDGYGTYNPYRRTVLDTGLTKQEAKAICRELNHADNR